MPVIIFLVLIGILLVMPAQADEYFKYTGTEMPVEIWVCDKCEAIECGVRQLNEPINMRKITVENEMWIIAAKGDKPSIGFKADCCEHLEILSVDEYGNICIISSYSSSCRDKCEKEGSIVFRKRGDYYIIFLCSINGNRELATKEFDQERTVKNIISNLIGYSYAVKKVNIALSSPEIAGMKIKPTGDYNQKIEISGKTNLPKDTELQYLLSGPIDDLSVTIESFDEIKVKRNGIINFEIDVGRENNNPGKYNLRIERKEGGHLVFEKTIILPFKQQIQSTPRAVSKPTPTPKITSKHIVRPEIKITPRPTFAPTPAVIKYTTVKQRIPAPTPTPKTNHSILTSIAGIAIVIFLKKFRNAFN